MATAKEAVVGGEWAWVCGFQNQVADVGEILFVLACVTAPQDEDDVVFFVEFGDYGVDEGVPPYCSVREWLTLADGKAGVEEQHTLTRPRSQVAVFDGARAHFGADFFDDVSQRWWELIVATSCDAERQADCLVFVEVRVLAKDYDFDLVKRAHIKRRENKFTRRTNFMTSFSEAQRFFVIGFVFGCKVFSERFALWRVIYFFVHTEGFHVIRYA